MIKCAILSLAALSASAQCLPYGPKAIDLSGTVVEHRGLRGWLGLAVDRPACTIRDTDNEGYQNVREMQLVLSSQQQLRTYKSYVGKRIEVNGTLFPRETGYHETDVLIMVAASRPAGVAMRQTRAKGSKATATELRSYTASATVVQASQTVMKSAWKGDPKAALSPAESYISHTFNGPKDVMWVTCRDGYIISSARSATASDVFKFDDSEPVSKMYGVLVNEKGRTNITIDCSKAAR